MSDDPLFAALSPTEQLALRQAGIVTLATLAARRPSEILQLHGVTPATIRKLQVLLEANGLHFGG